MASGSGGLNFTYQHGVSKQESYTLENFYIDCFKVGGFPVWEVSNQAGDDTWVGADNMPAAASLVIASESANPTPLTLFWGSGAHHRHHGGYQLAQGKAVIKVDWANARLQAPSGVQCQDYSGALPWAPNASGDLVQQLKDKIAAQDQATLAAIREMTGWYLVTVPCSGDGSSANDVSGSMTFDVFLVKAVDGSTYARINMADNGIAFDSNEEQQFIRFGVLNGDYGSAQLFTPAGEHQAPAWNAEVVGSLEVGGDPSVSVPLPPADAFVPTEQQVQTKTVTKTTSSGWSIGGNVGGSVGGNGGSGGSGGSGGGSGSGGDAGGGAATDGGGAAAGGGAADAALVV
jgi:hypothetical protein